MATHSNILAWRIPWMEEPGGLQFTGLQRVEHNWSDLACMHYFFKVNIFFRFLSKNYKNTPIFFSQLSSVTQSCPTLCDPMNRSTPGLPVHYQLPESTQSHAHWVDDAIQVSHPLSSPSPPPAFNLFQHQGLFQWVSSSHQVAKVLEFQLQHQSFQWTSRTDLL